MEEETSLRQVGTNRLEYKANKLILDKDNIGQFVRLDNARDVRMSNVKKLATILSAGKHFDTPIMCNLVGKKLRLLDGNHRVEAIKIFLERYPGRRVEVELCIYDNLNEEEEKAKYTLWNLGTKQTTNDVVKQYWANINITKYLEQPKFPCDVSHSWSGKNMEFKQLITPYIAHKMGMTSWSASAFKFIDAAQGLGLKDVNILKAFMQDFINVFGIPNRKNIHFKRNIFTSIISIWLNNYQNFSSQEIVKRFEKIRNGERVHYWSTSFGRESTEHAIVDLRNAMNKGYVKNLLV